MRNRRVRIGLNLLYIRPDRVGGTEVYARGLLQGLQEIGSEHEYVIFVNREAWETFRELDRWEGFRRILCSTPRSAAGRHVWEQVLLPSLCRREKIDLLHSCGYVTPLLYPGPAVVNIFDMLYELAPQYLSLPKLWFWRTMVPLSSRRANMVVTSSAESRNDIIRFLGVSPEKVAVTELGPGQEWPEPASWDELRERYQLPESYFLAVGAGTHKCVPRIQAALKRLRDDHRIPAELLVTGGGASPIPQDPFVHMLGRVPCNELVTLYQHCIALIHVSDMEGFGFPLVEGMSLGAPVIALRRGSVASVLGGRGVLLDDDDPAALARAMAEVASKESLRQELILRGKERAMEFSWKKCARETVAIYDRVLASARAREG